MPNAIWKGSISFGLVSVPVALHTAVRSHDLSFHQVNVDTGNRVRQRRVDGETGEEVAYDRIGKQWDPGDRRPVLLERDELDDLSPEASELLDIVDVVDLDQIDPVHFDRPYQVVPQGEAASRAYRLLVEALERTGRVAIATFVLRTRQHLAALRPRDGMLVLSTMRFADEVLGVPDQQAVEQVRGVELREREVEMAVQLVESLHTDFDLERYHDEHRDRMLAHLEARAEDRDPPADAGGERRGVVIDLTEALERSLSGGGEPVDDLAELTRDELYELAQQRDLPGRSSMSKAELLTALAATSTEAA